MELHLLLPPCNVSDIWESLWLNLCTAQGKGPEQVLGGRLGPARLGTFFEIIRKPDPV